MTYEIVSFWKFSWDKNSNAIQIPVDDSKSSSSSSRPKKVGYKHKVGF
jgi:hypothetical protein